MMVEEILSRLDPQEFPYIEVSVPTATVLTTELFDSFIQRNQLEDIASSDLPDDRIAHAFQQAELPTEHVGDLRALISCVHTPLAVRSSSLLEDHLNHPFAGVYGTKMVPNNEIEEDARFNRLLEAIKFVYATTFFAESKDYLRSIGVGRTACRRPLLPLLVRGRTHPQLLPHRSRQG
jgi:phosphoenolpyruvate synthase/pyruvate phosphate dikinase